MHHRMSENGIRHLFFILVTLPLSDPDDNSKRLKVAKERGKDSASGARHGRKLLKISKQGTQGMRTQRRKFASSTLRTEMEVG